MFTFEAESQAFWEASINAGLKIEYDLGFSVVAGYEYDSDGSGRGAYKDASFVGGPPSLDNVSLGILAEFAAGLEIDFEVLLYGQAGIELEARPKVVLEAAGDIISREIRWELKLSVPFDAAFEIEIQFGPINWENEFGDIEIAELNLVLFEGVIGGGGEPNLELTYTGPPATASGWEPRCSLSTRSMARVHGWFCSSVVCKSPPSAWLGFVRGRYRLNRWPSMA